MKKLIFITYIISSFSTLANDTLFLSANNDYSNEQYLTAIVKYESIINDNLESPELYYNLGNCYFRTNEIHKAIYYYEKTLKHNPNFNGAKENINLCKEKLIDKIDVMPELFYKKLFGKIKNSISFNTWIILTLISIWMMLFISIYSLLRRRRNYIARFSLLSLALILFCITININNDYLNNRSAIIYTLSTDIMSAPSAKSTKKFTLHIGTKLKINDQIGDWVNINIANGKKGWVFLEDIKEI